MYVVRVVGASVLDRSPGSFRVIAQVWTTYRREVIELREKVRPWCCWISCFCLARFFRSLCAERGHGQQNYKTPRHHAGWCIRSRTYRALATGAGWRLLDLEEPGGGLTFFFRPPPRPTTLPFPWTWPEVSGISLSWCPLSSFPLNQECSFCSSRKFPFYTIQVFESRYSIFQEFSFCM